MPASRRTLAVLLLAAGVAAAQPPDPLPEYALARFGTVRFRTGSSVAALAFSPDGKRLASWGDAMYKHDEFTLWDAATGKEIRSVRTTERTIMALAWPADGRGLAVLKKGEAFAGGRMETPDLTVFDFTADPPAALPAPQNGPRGFAVAAGGAARTSYEAVAVSADGTRLAAATSAGGRPDVVVVYELKPAKSLAELNRVASFDAPPNVCKTLAFTPDGKRLVGACAADKAEAATVVVWDAAGKIIRTVYAPAGSVQWGDVYLAASDRVAGIGLAMGEVFAVDLGTGTTRTLATGHKAKEKFQGAGVFALAFSPDGKWLATCGSDGMVRRTDLDAGKVIGQFGPHRSWPQALAVSADGKRITSGGQDGVIRVWDVESGKDAVPTGGHEFRVWRVSASANGKVIATEAGDETIRLWDPATGTEWRRIAAGGPVRACRLTPDGKQVVAVVGPHDSPNKALKAWDAATGADATPVGFPKNLPASGFQFTPDGKTLLTHVDDHLAAWAWPAGTKLWAADMPKPAAQGINQVDSIAVSPDGRHFATVASRYWYREEKGLRFGYGADGILDLWETVTGKPVRRLAESQACFRPAVFAGDGTLIHSGGGTLPGDRRDGQLAQTQAQICVLDPLTGRLVREFTPARRADGVNSGHAVALSADGRVLFRATDIGEVQLYEVATGKFRTTLPGHRDTILGLDAPATDVRRVVSGSADTTALWWDVGLGGKPVALSADERKTLWAALADPDAKAAYGTMTKLAADATGFVTLAAGELKPAPPGPTEADLAPLFKDLDAKAFAAREAATKALDKFGEPAVPLIRARLEAETSPEARERLTGFIARHTKPDSDPERLRQSRAVELLEHLRTPAAKELLAKLAKGGPARLTTDAAGAAKRLAVR
jgi:WD40 repeat protein